MQKQVQLFNGTEIVSAFEQVEMINYLIRNMLEDVNPKNKLIAERMQLIDNGICYMLSIEWLRLIHTNGDWRNFCNFSLNSQGNLELTKNEIAYYTQLADNFYQYAQLSEPGTRIFQRTFLQANVENCSNFRIDEKLVPICFGEGSPITVKKAMDIQKKLASFINSLNNYLQSHANAKLLIGIFFTDGTDYYGHELAMYKNNNDLYFFDCNYGLYQITDMNVFFNELWNHYNIYKAEITEIV